MDPKRRSELTRYAAPAAFLAAATIAVLLIKGGLSSSQNDAEPVSTVGALPTAATTTKTTPRAKVTVTGGSATSGTATTAAGGRYYTVQSGDTLGGIAAKYATSVEELLRLNPGVDPAALHVGQKIRVG